MDDTEVEADKEFGPTVDGVNKESEKDIPLQVESVRHIEILQKVDIFQFL